MKVKLLAFGQARTIIGKQVSVLEVNSPLTLEEFQHLLYSNYPELKRIPELKFAVNEEFVNEAKHKHLHSDDEVALLPPVSGG